MQNKINFILLVFQNPHLKIGITYLLLNMVRIQYNLLLKFKISNQQNFVHSAQIHIKHEYVHIPEILRLKLFQAFKYTCYYLLAQTFTECISN